MQLLIGPSLVAAVALPSHFEPQRKLDKAAANFVSDQAPGAGRSRFCYVTHRGCQPSPVTEQIIAAALNGLSTALALPECAQTTARQVRKLRFRHMTEWSPKFLGMGVVVDKTAGDATAISNERSPLQALHIALTMIDQKFCNPEYQRTPGAG